MHKLIIAINFAVFFLGVFYDTYLEEMGSPEFLQPLDSLDIIFTLCHFMKTLLLNQIVLLLFSSGGLGVGHM